MVYNGHESKLPYKGEWKAVHKKIAKWLLALILVFSVVAVANPGMASAAAKSRAYYAKEGAYVYKGKSTKSKKIRLLYQNKKVLTKTSKRAKYFYVKVGKTRGYALKSKLYTKPTWVYKANSKDVFVYKNSKKTKYAYLNNKKGATLISHKKPSSLYIKLAYKGKTYYCSYINLNINYKIKKLRKSFTKIKTKSKNEYNQKYSTSDYFYFTSKARAAKFKNKLKAYGFSQTKYGDILYTFSYHGVSAGKYSTYYFRVSK